MKTYEDLKLEVDRLNAIRQMDESSLVVRMVTLIALEWAMGQCPVSPSERLMEVQEELLEGAINRGGIYDGEGDSES